MAERSRNPALLWSILPANLSPNLPHLSRDALYLL